MSGDHESSFENWEMDTEELQRPSDDKSVMLRAEGEDGQLESWEEDMQIPTRGVISRVRAIPVNQEVPISKECNTSATGEYDGTIQQAISDMSQEDESVKLRGIQLVRKMLSRTATPPLDAVIAAGIVNKCVEFLKLKNKPIFQFEASWVLTNVASGTTAQTEVVIQSGAIPPLIEMLKSPYADLIEQSSWALGNCIGDSPQIRDIIIDLGVIPPLIAVVNTRTEINVLRNVGWVLSNIFRKRYPPAPAPSFSSLSRMCLPALVQLANSTYPEVVKNSCLSLSPITGAEKDIIQDVIDSGVVPRLIELLTNPDEWVVILSLQTLGSILTGSDAQTQVVIDAGILPQLTKILQQSKSSVVRYALWVFSNIAGGTVEQISLLMDSGAMPLICKVLETEDFRIQKEAIWVVANIIGRGTVEHTATLCNYQVLQRLLGCLNHNDWQIVIKVMDALENIIKAAGTVGQSQNVLIAIESCGGLAKIEQLQAHENNSVYKIAYSFIEKFFRGSEDDDQSLLPELLTRCNIGNPTNAH